MAFSIYKGGKLPPVRTTDMIALSDHLDKASTWPLVPPMGWEFAVNPRAWGMLGNDTVGDCAIAGLMHLIQGQSANIGDPLFATTKQAIDLYSAVTGYNPNDPDSDQGTVVTDLLKYAKKHGVQMTDSMGKVVTVKILAWASLDVSSPSRRCATPAYTFGGSLLGINCPNKCEDGHNELELRAGTSVSRGPLYRAGRRRLRGRTDHLLGHENPVQQTIPS